MISYEKYEELRNAAGMNNAEVSEKSGVPRSILSEWKNGNASVGLTTLTRLSGFFGVPVDHFIVKDETNE